MFTNTKFLILGLTVLLMANQGFSQQGKEPEIEQKLSLNFGVFSYTSFKKNSIEDKVNFKPVLSLTYNNRYEIGFSYINLYKSADQKMPHSPSNSINLEENKAYFGAYFKGYFGKEQNLTCQIGYNKLEHNNEQYDLITGYYNPNSPTELSNERTKVNMYTHQKIISITGGYSFKITPQFFIEPQLAYLIVNRESSYYNAIVNNTADLNAYPDNNFEVRPGGTEKFNDFQFSLTLTYRFTLIKQE